MSTTKPALNLRLSEDIIQELYRLHPGYGEPSKVIRQLIQHYIAARHAMEGYDDRRETQPQAIASTVLGVIRG